MGQKYRFGVLGAGNMGMAIAEGAVRAQYYNPTEILLFNRSEEKRAANQKKGFAVTDDYTVVYRQCETVLLAVKPQNMAEILPVLSECRPSSAPLILSIAAGVPFARLETALGNNTPIIRIMPNTPLLLGMGATQLVKNTVVTEEQLASVRQLFDTMGVTVVFDDENMLNEAIPYAGSAPAYLYAFADAMVQSAQEHSLQPEDALQLFCQTMIGSAHMLLQGDKTPAELIRAVCSPGGATLAGMKVLEEQHFYQTIRDMCDKCIERTYELGK